MITNQMEANCKARVKTQVAKKVLNFCDDNILIILLKSENCRINTIVSDIENSQNMDPFYGSICDLHLNYFKRRKYIVLRKVVEERGKKATACTIIHFYCNIKRDLLVQ